MLEVNAQKTYYRNGKEEFSLNVDFSVDAGITAVMGASGAGKSTLLRLIAGIISPDKGFISLDNKTFFDSEMGIDIAIQARRVGFVFQDYALFPHLSALENVAFGVNRKGAKNRKHFAREFLELFNIEHLESRLPSEMSGGEQQRTALARSLASEPKLVLLDEPLSAVDSETRTKILDEIEFAQIRTKIPFIYVTHNEDEANRLASARIMIKSSEASLKFEATGEIEAKLELIEKT